MAQFRGVPTYVVDVFEARDYIEFHCRLFMTSPVTKGHYVCTCACMMRRMHCSKSASSVSKCAVQSCENNQEACILKRDRLLMFWWNVPETRHSQHAVSVARSLQFWNIMHQMRLISWNMGKSACNLLFDSCINYCHVCSSWRNHLINRLSFEEDQVSFWHNNCAASNAGKTWIAHC